MFLAFFLKVGQYYESHHDFTLSHLLMPCGPRLYTFFLYLSNVTEGGATKFNHLGFQVVVRGVCLQAYMWQTGDALHM